MIHVLSVKNKFEYVNKNDLFLYALLLPSFIYLAIFFLYPIVLSVRYSLTNMTLYNLSNYAYIGFENYISLFHTKAFFSSLYISIIFLVVSAIIGQMFLGSIIAYMLSIVSKNVRAVIVTILLMAWATPQVTAGIIWYSTLSYIPSGTINFLISTVGLTPINFLSTRNALYSIIIANIWLGLGFSVLLFSAGLQNISPHVIASAKVDGAGPFSTFTRIVFPMLKNSILTDLILITLFTLGTFTMVYVMTGGGPAGATNLLTIYQYNNAFSLFEMGIANAIGVIIIIIAIALSLLYLKVIKIEG